MISMRQNYGQARLTNVALQASKFRYVCRMDADNELVPENLPLFLRSARQTGAAMVYGNLLDKRGGDIVGIRSNRMATLQILGRNYIDAFSVLDAEKIIQLGGLTRVHPYSPDDYELILHLIAEEQQIILVPAVMGYYHLNESSASLELSHTNEGREALQRIYAQTGTRPWDDMRVGHIYHPDTGFLDEW
jgi:glycosyltransferase involved in cell wall biosynthesis